MSAKRFIVWVFVQLVFMASGAAVADEYTSQRLQMVAKIKGDLSMVAKQIDRKSYETRVMVAMESIPRHLFVPKDMQARAYEDRPLPIGYGQTISQPYIVAYMTTLLQPQPDHHVLEIGTGSGYQAAVLSALVKQVYSIEIIEKLGKATQRLLSRQHYDNIEIRIADGYEGWPEHAPFDSIIVTAAISHIPPPLVAQLKNGGRMIIPVGTRFQTQYLTLIEKDKQGTVTIRQLLPVVFVPFTGGH